MNKTSEKEGWFTLSLYGDDLHKWKVIMDGPKDTPYEGGKFEIKFTLPAEYPHKPPTLEVMTKIYSPVISPDEHTICAPILQTDNKPDNWAPTSSIYDVLLVFRDMLVSPPANHVADVSVAQVLSEHPEEFKKTAAEWTKKYAHA